MFCWFDCEYRGQPHATRNFAVSLTSLLGPADEDVGEYFNDNLFKDEAAPGARASPLWMHHYSCSAAFTEPSRMIGVLSHVASAS